MQLISIAHSAVSFSPFQSSPVPEDGCNGVPRFALAPQMMFQSSPVPEDGCNKYKPC